MPFDPPVPGLALAAPTRTLPLTWQTTGVLLAAVLFFVTCISLDQCVALLGAAVPGACSASILADCEDGIAKLKESVFFASLIGLLFCARHNRQRVMQCWHRNAWGPSALIMLALLILSGGYHLGGFGLEFQGMSASPFSHQPIELYRRVLFPALSFYLHINNLFFPLWSWLVTWACVALVVSTLDSLSLGKLGWIEKLAACTCSFVAFQFQLGGYADLLVVLLGLILWRADLDEAGEFCIIVLLLLTHEALATVTLIPLYPRLKNRAALPLLFALYGLAWLSNFHFGLRAALTAQQSLGHSSSLSVLAHHPATALIAVLIAYKLIGLAMGRLALRSVRQQRWQDACLYLGGPLLCIGQVCIASDSSRLAGMAFIPAIAACATYLPTLPTRQRWLFALLQIAIPSCFVNSAYSLSGAYSQAGGLYGLLLALPHCFH